MIILTFSVLMKKISQSSMIISWHSGWSTRTWSGVAMKNVTEPQTWPNLGTPDSTEMLDATPAFRFYYRPFQMTLFITTSKWRSKCFF